MAVVETGADDGLALIAQGTVIPAHPLALDASLRLNARRQRALTRYYLDAGAGGLAVGVHATQFQIGDAGLHVRVLELAAAALEHVQGRVFLDLPDPHAAFGEALEAAGFTAQRAFMRMTEGGRDPGEASLRYALAGPEFG